MIKRKEDKKIVVLYHGNCEDGFGGAFAAWRHFGNKAEYIPLYRHAPVPELYGKEVYMIDFMYSPEIIRRLLKNNIRVTGIDHHITAEDSTRLTKNYLFSLKNSGAALAWQYFHPKKKIPRLLQYIEDYDLWKFRLRETREVSAMLDLLPFDFQRWEKFAKDLENGKKRKQIVANGKLLLEYKNKLVDSIVAEAEEVQFMGYRARAVNSPVFNSEIGARLIKKASPLVIIWIRSRGRILVSLRSNGKTDVARIAQKFGGGGHKAAAGFIVEKNEKVPWVPVK